MIILYITFPSKDSAKVAISSLLEKRLIACANLLPIESIYNWKGKKEENTEIVALLKTQEKLYEEVKKELEKKHPYEVPCILKIKAEANSVFETWIQEETQ